MVMSETCYSQTRKLILGEDVRGGLRGRWTKQRKLMQKIVESNSLTGKSIKYFNMLILIVNTLFPQK